MNKIILEAIKENECTTKEAALKRLEKKIVHYVREAKENSMHPEQYYALMLIHLELFYKKIQNAVLFEKLPNYWIYDFSYAYDCFSLNLEHINEYKVTDNKEYHSSRCDATYSLVALHPTSLTVDQYARLYEVEQGTVRQWIRRGKIRTAYKEGKEWRIPKLSPPPQKSYEVAQYKWINGVDNLPQEYGYLADYVLATFRQDRKDKSKYHVYLVSKETFASDNPGDVAMRKNKELVLNTNEREKLELFMISHPQIKYCGHMI